MEMYDTEIEDLDWDVIMPNNGEWFKSEQYDSLDEANADMFSDLL